MIRLVYVSNATHLLSEEELFDLLRVSQENNQRDQITGMLVYENGNFMQVLEGPEEEVEALMRRIEKDDRHGSVTVLLRKEAPRRYFPEWSMAFASSSEMAPEDRGHLSDFMDRDILPESEQNEAGDALQMLKAFRNTVRPEN